MKKEYLLTAFLAVLSFNLSAQTIADFGKDWDPEAGALIDATSGVFFASGKLAYEVNPGTSDEVKFNIGGGATAASASNNGVYKNPMPSSISYCQIGAKENETYFEGLASEKYITGLQFNGTSGGTDKGVIGGLLYSDKLPFDENYIIGTALVEFPACRAGGVGVVITDVPANTRSFRIYNPAIVVASGNGYILANEGDTIGNKAQTFRVAYVKVTLGELVPTTVPYLTKVSGESEQNIFLGQSITPIEYHWSGSATSATLAWTGGSTPVGITVNTDVDAKNITISGTPAAAGDYSWSITATDGVATTDPLTGSISVTVPTKPLIAYITNNAQPTDAGDVAIIDKLKETYEVDILLSSNTNLLSGADTYKALVLAALPGSGDAGLKYLKDCAYPIVNLKPFMLQSSRWNWGSPKNIEGSSLDAVPTGVTVVDAAHPVFKGLNTSADIPLASGSKHASFRILTPMDPEGWIGNNAANLVSLAKVPTTSTSYPEAPVIFELIANSVMDDAGAGDRPITGGVTITAKNIYIGVSEQTAGYLTADYLTIVKNAVDYVSGSNTGIRPVFDNSGKTIFKVRYFDLLGKEIPRPAKGIVIEVSTFTDGSVKSQKKLVTEP
ncbi:MAG: hypothetical protein LBB85_03045 [Dysgonamonadaceae bacterium]|jgi:hypothetical protein|nr:hypothetical protein [Dysgonamonadaceae bacterium]